MRPKKREDSSEVCFEVEDAVVDVVVDVANECEIDLG